MSDEFEEQLRIVKKTEDDFKRAKAFAKIAGADLSPGDKEKLVKEAGKLYTIATGKEPPDLSTPEARKKFEDELTEDIISSIDIEPNQEL